MVSESYFKNRRRRFDEQYLHWKNSWRSGILRFLERFVVGFNVSDKLGGNLGNLLHLEAVQQQVESRTLISTEETKLISINPVNSFHSVVIDRTCLPQYAICLNNFKVDTRTGLGKLDAGFLVDAALFHWQNIIYRGGMAHSAKLLSRDYEVLPGIWTVMPYSNFFYHGLIEHLPQILQAVALEPSVRVLVRDGENGFVLQLLDAYKIDFCVSRERVVRAEKCVVITSPRGISAESVALLRKVSSNVGNSANRKLFLARGERLDRTDDDLQNRIYMHLAQYGYECVDPGSLSIREQMDCFKNASHLVGFHGGALSGMVWSQEGTKVIELFNHDFRTYDFALLANACGHDYQCLELTHPIDDRTLIRVLDEVV